MNERQDKAIVEVIYAYLVAERKAKGVRVFRAFEVQQEALEIARTGNKWFPCLLVFHEREVRETILCIRGQGY